jgi:hypothetical protein
MKMTNLNKTKVLLAMAALVMTTACSDKKKDPAAETPVEPQSEAVCYNDPASCNVGQQYSLGFYLAATSNEADINARRAIAFKLAFYGSDGDAVYRSATNTNVFYTGPVVAVGTAKITIQDRDEDSVPVNGIDLTLNDGRGNGNNSRRCKIPEGDYTITTTAEGDWAQRAARKNADNSAKIAAIELQLESNGNLLTATLEDAAVNFRKEGLSLTGTLNIHRLNKQNCEFIVDL